MGSLSDVITRGRLTWRLLSDPRVPTWIKVAIPFIVLAYFIAPVDLIPDFLPVVGQLDDLGVLLLGMTLIIRLSPQYVVAEHRAALGYDTDSSFSTATGTAGNSARKTKSDNGAIDGEYKVVHQAEKE